MNIFKSFHAFKQLVRRCNAKKDLFTLTVTTKKSQGNQE